MSDEKHSDVTVTTLSDGAIQVTIPLTITLRLGAQTVTAPIKADAVVGAVAQPVVAKAEPVDSPELTGVLIEAESFHDRAYIPEGDADAASEYYGGIDTSGSPDELFDALSDLLVDTHKTKLPYAPSGRLYPWVDRQLDGGITSIYTGERFDVPTLIRESFRAEETLRHREASLKKQESVSAQERTAALDALEATLPFNCEHVVPQSWFGKRSPMRGDLHHLFACETRCNSFRGNTPYFDFTETEERVLTGCGRSEQDKFEPQLGKGAVARATLYFLLRYPGQVNPGEMPADRLAILVRWAKEEAPSEYEKHRNATIFEVQGNRNPFIDHPEWLFLINFARGIS